MNKAIYAIAIFLGVFLLLAGLFVNMPKKADDGSNARVSSFEECAKAGYPVMESFPRQCRTPDGTLFIEKIEEVKTPSNDDIPQPEGEKGARTSGAYDGCVITGCSGQVCADEEVITTCEFLPEYACFKEAVCERNQNNECTWRHSDTLVLCIENARETGSQNILQ